MFTHALEAAEAAAAEVEKSAEQRTGLRTERDDARAALIRERECHLADNEQEQAAHPRRASSPDGRGSGGQGVSPRSHSAPATRASTASAAPDEAAAAPQAVRPDVAPPHAPPDGRGVSTAGAGAESPHEQAAHRCVDHQPSAIEAAGRSAECDANHDTVDRRSSDTGTPPDTPSSDTTSSGVVSGREGVGEAVAPDMPPVDAHRGANPAASWSVVGPSAARSPQSSPAAARDAAAAARRENALAALIRERDRLLAEKEQEQTEHPQGASSPNGGSGGGQPASPASRSHNAPATRASTASAAPDEAAAAASVAETAVAPGDESAPASPEPVPVPAAPEAPRTTPEASRRSSSIRRSFASLFSSTDSEKKESKEKKAKKAKKNKKNKAAASSEALVEAWRAAPQADVQQPASADLEKLRGRDGDNFGVSSTLEDVSPGLAALIREMEHHLSSPNGGS
eukprot:Rhum_TRINITY_DN14220_c6_g1::Rhum_TRINITY_DN14220_c6_g1_i2::g.74321::m.74321